MRKLLLALGLFCPACTDQFFQPTRTVLERPQDYGYTPQEVVFPSLDGSELQGWLFPGRLSPGRGLVLQLHGNAGNLGDHAWLLTWLTDHGYDLFCFDYRGYGKSQGKPSLDGLVQDARAAIAWASAAAQKKNEPLIIYGQSLGGTLALRALGTLGEKPVLAKPPARVVSEGAFYSYPQVGREVLAESWLTWPFQGLAYLLVSGRQDPGQTLEKIPPLPLLIMHGRGDPIIPAHHAQEIYGRAGKPKCLWLIPGRAHIENTHIEKGKHRAALLHFFETGECAAYQQALSAAK